MDVPGEEQYIGRGVAFCPHCDGPLYKNKRIAVIGGGNSAVRSRHRSGRYCRTCQRSRSQYDTDGRHRFAKQAVTLKNVTLITQALTSEVKGNGQKVTGLVYEDMATVSKRTLDVEGIFVQIGQVPTTEWLKKTPVKLNEKNEIDVDAYNRTNVPGIFAAGDVSSSPYKQIVIAMGDGAKAALSAFDYLIRN